MKQLFRVWVGKTPHLLHGEPGTSPEMVTLCRKTKIIRIEGGFAVKRPKGATKCGECRRAA